MRPATRPVQPLTPQEIINHVYAHFITEGNPQSKDDCFCVYNGTGCAVGCLLTEDDANTLAKYNSTIGNFIADEDSILSCYANISVYPSHELLARLQSAHDFYSSDSVKDETFTQYFLRKLTDIAKYYGLTLPVNH